MHGKPLEPGELEVRRLGEPELDCPLPLPPIEEGASGSFVPEGTRVRCSVEVAPEGSPSTGGPTALPGPGGGPQGEEEAEPEGCFEKAGPRERIFFDPKETRAALVTCGGLCPGINNVVRSAFNQFYYRYGVREILGMRYGFQGLNPSAGPPPVPLTPKVVEGIHRDGGTVLGSSRGPQNPALMVDCLQDREIDILLCIGGDGTQRGAHAIWEEAERRGLELSVIGVPKTIDNDIPFVYRSFGFYTALEKAREVITGAHTEASGVPNGIGLVKLMGRYAGFIAAGATLASQEVNFTLIPEVPFDLDAFLEALLERLEERGHAVVVVAEGAGQDLFPDDERERDASGNVKLRDVGALLRERIGERCRERGVRAPMKYFDPSYLIRSAPANTADSLLCDALARHAVHAAMAGRTDMLVGYWHNVFVHVPIPAVVRRQKRLEPKGGVWMAVLEATGQPRRFRKGGDGGGGGE